MATAKIEIKVGSLHFLGEGEQEWVTSQLDKVLAEAHKFSKLGEQIETTGQTPKPPAGGKGGQASTLASFLSSKNATTKQVAKFLATAGWIHLKGKQRMSASDVAKALKDSHQGRLGNPADCLNQNVGKGFCEKDGGEFFITAEGLAELGLSN